MGEDLPLAIDAEEPAPAGVGSLNMKAIRPESPVRVVIHSADIHEQVPGVGTAFTGLIESGVLRKEQTLLFQPASREQNEPVTAQVDRCDR